MKKIVTLLVAMAFMFVAVGTAFAVVKDSSDPVGKVGGDAIKTVGEAAKGSSETAVSPVVAFWRWMTGKGKPEKVVTEPVEKTGKTVYDAGVNTGKTVTQK